MDWAMVISLVSALAGIAAAVAGITAAWFGYVAVRDKVRRRSRRRRESPQPEPSGAYDAFISYAPDDEDTAETLARNLTDRGIQVFLAKWIGPGLVEYLEKEQALSTAANGILLFSNTTMTRPDIRDEYAALLQRTHNGGRRFIPVLIDHVELPPFAKIRKPLDLTTGHDETNLDTLTRALQPQPSS